MALIKPQGTLSWTASASDDVVSYMIYQGADGNPPTYDSPHVNVGNVTTIQLPVEGLPMVEGSVVFAVAAVDSVGNLSDLAPAAPVLIDVSAPLPPTDPIYTPGF